MGKILAKYGKHMGKLREKYRQHMGNMLGKYGKNARMPGGRSPPPDPPSLRRSRKASSLDVGQDWDRDTLPGTGTDGTDGTLGPKWDQKSKNMHGFQ